ncbi:MAG: hypothetical protein K2P93_08600 [Alphaproteobacteria bacterium]|nr:hypothetical protein [Alphaproteobacteria bacterium]
MYKFNTMCISAIFASCLLSATALASGKQEKKPTIEKGGEDIGKTAKKLEHGYKKHIVQPVRDFAEGVKEGKKKQKGKHKKKGKDNDKE